MEDFEISVNKVKCKIYFPSDKTKVKEIFIICHGVTTKENAKNVYYIINELVKNDCGVVCFDFIETSKYKHYYKEKLCLYRFQEKFELIYSFLKERYPNYMISLFSSGFGAYVALVSIIELKLSFNKVILNTPAINMREIFKKKLGKGDLIDLYKINARKLKVEKMEQITDFYNELVRKDLFNYDTYLNNLVILHEKENKVIPIEDSKYYIINKCKKSKVIGIDSSDNISDYVIKILKD